MPGIVEGYNYDIFISYRQKDNRQDGWVTEFVDNLRKELEATFKEEITLYFDTSPHDGILDNHDVDESLKDKLKCLIFIPIISRTYCDPKSFAWDHEFRAFVQSASKDKYGLKIKLPGGNVAGRVLPIRIYDLDDEDTRMFESVIGSRLRGIDFIYSEAGVNRPLRANEVKPLDNLNHTTYRNQINKVGNMVKDIISGIRQSTQQKPVTAQNIPEYDQVRPKKVRWDLKIWMPAAILLILSCIYFSQKLFTPREELEKSIAVLPFRSLSDDPEKQYIADGMMDAITLHLSKIKDLRVMGRTSTEQYRNTTSTLNKIGKELGVNYLLEASFQQSGDSVRLIVQVIKIKKGKEGHVWAKLYVRPWKNIFSVQSEVAQSIAGELRVVITPEEKQLIEKMPTSNLTAYDYYQRGNSEVNHVPPLIAYISIISFDPSVYRKIDRAEFLYNKALEYDPAFALAYAGLAKVYYIKDYAKDYLSKSFLDTVVKLADKALFYDNKLSQAYLLKGNYFYEHGKIENATREYNLALRYNPNDWEVYFRKGFMYSFIDPAQGFENLLIAADRNRGPELPSILNWISFQLIINGFYEQARPYLLKTLNLDGDSVSYLYYSSLTYSLQKEYKKSIDLLNHASNIDSTRLNVLSLLAESELFMADSKESLKHYIKWYESGGRETFSEMQRIGYAYLQNGEKEKADYFFNKCIDSKTAEIELGRLAGTSSVNFQSYYDLATAYAGRGENEKAIENLRLFGRKSVNHAEFMLHFFRDDPLLDNLRNEPEFQKILKDYELKVSQKKEKLGKWLMVQGIL